MTETIGATGLPTALVADIGGTNARFGLVDANGLRDLAYLPCAEYAGPVEAVTAYLSGLATREQPVIGIFAIAGPVEREIIHLTNASWSFRIEETAAALGLRHLEILNDFDAVARSIPGIDPALVVQLGTGVKQQGGTMGIIGPGTGLGVASLFWDGAQYRVNACEGGHVTMPATTEREFEIFQQLKVKYHHISAERVISGKGLINLYNAIRALDKRYDLPDLTPAEISGKAIAQSCAVCIECLDLMLAFLGRISGNLALTLNATGGIYIAGGITPKIIDYFAQSRFLHEFEAKGRMSDLMRKTPVFLIRHDAIALKGLETYAKAQLYPAA